jgi:predicted nucleotide-binding protein
MPLPVLTTAEDTQAIVDYLKTKALGATVQEAKRVIEPAILDGRKLNAYQTWGLIQRDGDHLKLATLGRELGRVKPEERSSIYAKIIRSISPYHAALEWMFYQNFDEVTNVDIAAHWHEHFQSELGTTNETSIKDMALCFFRLAEAAKLGELVVGRKGQTTRFRISREPLGQYIAEGALTGTESLKEATAPALQSQEPPVVEITTTNSRSVVPPALKSRLFISHGKNMAIVEQLKTMLELNDLDYEIAVEEETTAIPVSEKVFSAMHRCNAAVICVTADENERRPDGQYGINQNVLIEIGAAFVLYEKRVILVWDKRIDVPSNLQGLYRCEFTGHEFSWADGMKLMKAISNFRK